MGSVDVRGSQSIVFAMSCGCAGCSYSVESSGLLVREWIDFSDIGKDLRRVGGELLEGEAWFRRFLCIAVKV